MFSGAPIAAADATPLVLPAPSGAYGVGMHTRMLTDPARTGLRDAQPKRWMTTVFYPTEKTDAMAPYMPGTLNAGDVCGTPVLGHAIPEAPPLTQRKRPMWKHPLIIAMPGRGNIRQQYSILFESLASHGYVVIAMDQPYCANFVKFADGSTATLTLKDAWTVPRDRDYRYRYDDEMIEASLKDIDFLLDHFDDFAPLSDIFDTSQIILMGHSLGANIAHIKGFRDRRIRAVVDIDSKITERPVFGTIGIPPNSDHKPVLIIRGMLQYQEDVGDRLTKIPNVTIWAPKVQHSAFSDDAYFSAKIPHYGMSFWRQFLTWLLKQGPCFSNVDTGLGTYTVDQWFQDYPAYIVDWLNSICETIAKPSEHIQAHDDH